jgi:putative phage-type endonuclease
MSINPNLSVVFVYQKKLGIHGLQQDATLLEKCLNVKGRHADPLEPPSQCDVAFHLEIPVYGWMPWASKNVCVVNPEWWNSEWNSYLSRIDLLIFKCTEDAERFTAEVKTATPYLVLPWTSPVTPSAYKAFESQSSINQLIYEKCQPLKSFDEDEEVKMVNTNTAMHWGQKYEPLSVMIYEAKYGTKVEDFGCIQHPIYKFLGASPDGIVINKESQRYGRMLEIKNPVSREITGIPKKEYWTQMQLQMEVCDLDECDFLETKFKEGMTWENHGEWHIDHIKPCASFNLLDDYEQKKCFHYKNLQPLWATENLRKGDKELII